MYCTPHQKLSALCLPPRVDHIPPIDKDLILRFLEEFTARDLCYVLSFSLWIDLCARLPRVEKEIGGCDPNTPPRPLPTTSLTLLYGMSILSWKME